MQHDDVVRKAKSLLGGHKYLVPHPHTIQTSSINDLELRARPHTMTRIANVAAPVLQPTTPTTAIPALHVEVCVPGVDADEETVRFS